MTICLSLFYDLLMHARYTPPRYVVTLLTAFLLSISLGFILIPVCIDRVCHHPVIPMDQ